MKKKISLNFAIALIFVGVIVSGNLNLGFAQAVDKLKFVGQSLTFGAFVLRFDSGGTFTLEGKGWPSLNGNWKSNADEIELTMAGGPGGCDGAGRYQFSFDGKHLSFNLASDDCRVRRVRRRRGRGVAEYVE